MSMSVVEERSLKILTILGNPAQSRLLKHHTEGVKEVVGTGSTTEGPIPKPGEEETFDKGSTSFLYKADAERYETGYHINVRYSWNKDEVDCVENEILKADSNLDIPTFQREILDKIRNLYPVTLVEIKTVNGSIEVSELPRDIPEELAFLPIPKSLAHIPRVRLSGLRKCPVSTRHPVIDIVTRDEDLGPSKPWYVYKRYGIPIENQDAPMGDLLSEVELLSRIDSPHVIKPSFLVTDDLDFSFRGFLMPFMPAGALPDVFDELSIPGFLDREPMFLHPRHLEPCKMSRCRHHEDSEEEDEAGFGGNGEEDAREEEEVTKKPSSPRLPWSIKLLWAIEATSALAVLHKNGVYSGDVKLDNILLDRDGHVKFIDVAPQDGYSDPYLAPELDPLNDIVGLPLTEARDIFAFGLVLWQIAEEEGSIQRCYWSESPHLPWSSSGQLSAPRWYQELVQLCVEGNPAKRPSAKALLQVLVSQK